MVPQVIGQHHRMTADPKATADSNSKSLAPIRSQLAGVSSGDQVVNTLGREFDPRSNALNACRLVWPPG